MLNKILFIAPHPDDETLGCGGTILKYKKEKKSKIYWLIMTKLSKNKGFTEEKVNRREDEIKKVAHNYGFEKVFKLDYSPGKLDTTPIIKMISDVKNILEKIKPECIYIPNRSDIHSDHRIVFNVLMSALKSFRTAYVKKILMYEVLSETEFAPSLIENAFIPNVFVDISDYVEEKIRIMKLYEGEMAKPPFPRSEENIRALARLRGSMSNCNYSESFMLLKEIC
ncbi:MAG: GlcNAc-PI de-N-acetylase [Candidatus Levybacteria bacterium RIFCSPHIGHO2_01_FULL_36_15]|nr:MAG: GlcNAc-PI de-N-acetylase [Candidatus Levybacteria bacterium RIFCSPHIGHO2_01_FULL_36_15]